MRNANSGKLRTTFTYTPIPFDHQVPILTAAGSGPSFIPAIGVARIKIVEARGLRNQEAVGVSDPYVKLLYSGAMRAKTEIIDGTLEPVWNEVTYMLIRDTSLRGSLSFEIFDFNNLQKDKVNI